LQLTRQMYDVIISEPSNPWMAGLAALFTCDFFQLARDRLSPGGLFVQFFHSYEMDWATFALVGRSFAHVFPNSVLVVTEPAGYGYDYLLVGFNGPQSVRQDQAEQNFLYAKGSSNIRLADPRLFYRMVVAENVSDLFGQGPLNTDARPILEFAAPKIMYSQKEGGLFSSDPEIWGNLYQRGRRMPETIKITDELTGSIDRQIDYVEYALSVHSPFQNMVNLEGASETQKQRLTGVWEAYCRNNVPMEFSVMQDPEIIQRCHRVIAETIQERIDSVPHKGISYYTIGDQYLALREFEDAARAYEKAREFFENPFVLNNYAVALTQMDRMPDAMEILEKAAIKYPDSSNVRRTLAFLYNRAGRTEEAIGQYQKALEIKPDFLEAASELGILYTEKGRLEAAIEVYNQILRYHPQNAGLYNDLGIACLEMGQKQAAVEHFARALAIQPAQYQILNNVRQVILSEEPAEAIRLSKIVCQITQNKNAGLLSALAIAYMRAQQWEPAQAAAQQALELAQQTGPEGLIQEIQDNLKRIESRRPIP
jgi:spermidine synthase